MADPVRGIQLVGAPNALPPDIAAQAQQAALAQQLAQALLASSMQPEPAIVHTGGANPFARDVPNFGPLGKIVQSYLGSKGMADSSNVMAQLAQLGEARRQSDLGAANAYVPTTGADPLGGAPGENPDAVPMMRPPTIGEQIQRLQMSSHPANQAIAQSLLEHQFGNEEKQMVTPQAYSELISPRGGMLTQEGVANRLTRLPFTGAPGLRMTTAGGAPVNVTNAAGASLSGQPVGNAPPGSPDKQGTQIITNPDGSVISIPPGGTASILKTPTTEASEQTAKTFGEILDEGRGQTRAFQSMVPIVGTMLKLAEAEKNQMGWGAPQITEARQLAKRLGVSDDDLGHISNIQTLMKYALVPAINTARSLTTRPSQMEFMKTLEASAADPRVDARAAANIFRGFLVNGLNQTEIHNKNLDIAEGIPALKPQVAAYRVPEMSNATSPTQQAAPNRPGEPAVEAGPSTKLENSVFPYLKGVPNVNLTKDQNGIWYDRGVVDVPQAEQKALADKNIRMRTLPGGATAYQDPKTGKWYNNPDLK